MTAPAAQLGLAFPAPWVRVQVVREPAGAGVEPCQVRSPADAARLVRQRSDLEAVEVFYVLTLDAQNNVTTLSEVTRGVLDASLVQPREVFQRAILANAASVIVAHNHPSGNPTPSPDDRAVTRNLVAAGQVLNIPVCDHVIVGAERFYSFAEAGLL